MHVSERVFIICSCFYFLNFGETRILHIKHLARQSSKIVKYSLIKKSTSILAYRNSWTLDASVRRWALDAGLWTLDSGLWRLDAGIWTLDPGRWIMDAGSWTLDSHSGRWTLHFGRWILGTDQYR